MSNHKPSKAKMMTLGGIHFLVTVILILLFWQTFGVHRAESLKNEFERVLSNYGAEISWSMMNDATHSLSHDISRAKDAAFLLHEQIETISNNAELSAAEKRELMGQISKNTLTSNDLLLGVYTNFTFNSLGNDSQFVNNKALGSNEIGRFTPYYTIAQGGEGVHTQIQTENDFLELYKDEFGVSDNYWYTCVFQTKEPCLIEPYFDLVQGAEYLMFSIALPVIGIDEQTVIGVVGIDVALDDINEIVTELDQQIFEGAAEVILVNSMGQVIANSEDPDATGKLLKELTSQASTYKHMLATGKHGRYTEQDSENILVFAPIKTLPNSKPFGLFVEIPQSAIQADADLLKGMSLELQDKGVIILLMFIIAYVLITGGFYWVSIVKVTQSIEGIKNKSDQGTK